METDDSRLVLDITRTAMAVLDEIRLPRLLHGDLWHQNLLIQRTHIGATIVGVLDTGFARWGDPPADWTMIRLALLPPTEAACFWETYGPLDQSTAAQIRAYIYQAWSLGNSLLETYRLKNTAGHQWVRNKLHDIAMMLQTTPLV